MELKVRGEPSTYDEIVKLAKQRHIFITELMENLGEMMKKKEAFSKWTVKN